MNHERDQRVEQLFLAASELEPEQRSEFLDKACPDDAALRAEVTALLAQDADPHELMKTLALGKGVQDIAAKAMDAAAGTESSQSGSVQGRPSGMSLDQIGLYRITREIGRGGMGVVYEATQEHPRRTVALKVLAHGFASRSAMRRFEYESHILGQLRHPGIAQVYEAGTYRDDSGAVPFFAMEYVPDAKSITEYSAEAKLSISDRLALFANVCNAVHHGHQKGIIHRDLKPANILVDAQGQVKIIDFGVARSTDSDLAVTTVQTDIGQLVGTLQYMSPEQCQADPHSIDIRSDVYALGVVFYELLCGRLPYDVRRTAIHEATRVIREEPPARLSSVNKSLRGDIETIALKALEKERERRYASALELAEDIHRYLGNEPLKARPPSAIYMLRKFARRNRVLVAATMTVMCTLVAGVVVSTTLAIKTKRAEGQARRQQYVANIRAADFALSADDVTAVGRFLDQAPPNLRKWEWYYLRAASDTSLLSLTGHAENIRRVAFTGDGSGLASVSADGIVCTWDRATGSAQFKIRVGSVVTESVAMNSDGSLVALGGDDGAVRVWQTSSGKQQALLPVHPGRNISVTGVPLAFSPDDSRLAIGSLAGAITVWSLPDGELAAVLEGHEGTVGCLAFSPDGSQLASGGFHEQDMTIRVWDVSKAKQLQVFRGDNNGGAYAVAFSPDGRRLASASQDNYMRLWDTSDGSEIRTFLKHPDDVTSVAFSPDGMRLASATCRGTIRIWDSMSGRGLAVLRGHQGAVSHLAFSRDGSLLASGSADMTVRIWDGSGGAAQPVLKGHIQSVTAVAFSPDSRYVASAAADGFVVVWDLATRTQMARRAFSDHDIPGVAFNRNGNLVASALGDNGISVWSWTENRVLPPLTGHTDSVTHVHFSPESDLLASASADHTVRLWEVSSGRELAVLQGHTDRVLTAVFSSDGRRIVSSSSDGTTRAWDVHDHRTLWHVPHEGIWARATFAPDDRYVVTHGSPAPIAFLDAETGSRRSVSRGTEPSTITFSPCGNRLAAIMRDSDLHLLDPASGDEFLHFRGHDGERVQAVAFGPDGTRIASAGQDQTVHIWDIVPCRVRYAESMASLATKDGDFQEAEDLYRTALTGIRAALGQAHPGTLAPLGALVGVLSARGKYAEAEPLAVVCFEVSEGAYGVRNVNTVTAIKLLVDLYERWSKPDDAAKWRERMP